MNFTHHEFTGMVKTDSANVKKRRFDKLM